MCAIKTSGTYINWHQEHWGRGGVPVPINVKCTNVLKEELNLLMIYFIVCLFQFFLCSHKLEPLSLPNTLFPLRATNQQRACMKESVSRLQVHSIWTALLDKHVNSAPYLLSSFLPSFIRKGPNMSTPQFVKGGSSIVLSVGRSAICCSPSFPCNNQHLTHFLTKLLTIVLHRTTQNPLLLISLMVSPLSP